MLVVLSESIKTNTAYCLMLIRSSCVYINYSKSHCEVLIALLFFAEVYSRKIALVKLIVGNHQFSWEDICTALEEMNETMLATQIRSKYCNEDTSHSESTSEDQSISGKSS